MLSIAWHRLAATGLVVLEGWRAGGLEGSKARIAAARVMRWQSMGLKIEVFRLDCPSLSPFPQYASYAQKRGKHGPRPRAQI